MESNPSQPTAALNVNNESKCPFHGGSLKQSAGAGTRNPQRSRDPRQFHVRSGHWLRRGG